MLKNLRHIISLLLALCLTVGMLPTRVLADEEDTSQEITESTGETEATETEEETEPEETEPEETEDDLLHSQSSSMSFDTEVEPQLFVDVPNFYQEDYPKTKYGDGTVATSGCTITCLAMAASFLQGRVYRPDLLAEQFQEAGSDNIQRMEAAADALGLSYEKARDWGSVTNALDHDRLVIVQLEAPSAFTSTGHTLLLTGYGAGGILVNDPKKGNYGRSELQSGFENGFPEKTISEGFAGGWIFEDTDTARAARALREEQEGLNAGRKHVELNSVPLYLQTDYPNIRYNDGTIATSGCVLTCTAMVASYLRQEEILPDELVRRFGTYESSNIQRMEAAAIVLDLPYETTLSWWETREALKQGKIAVVLLEADSEFTNIQHTVVATGLNAEGRVLINDPNGRAYRDPDLKEGFEKGFPDDMLIQGFSGAWIFDRYDPPEPMESRYPDFNLTDEELHLIASIIWLEARGEPFKGQQAIAEIIFNRLASGKFSKTVQGTIMAEGQFRTAKFLEDAKPGELQYKAIEMALSGHNVLPENVYFFGRKPANKNVWGQIGKHVFCKSY